MRQLHGFQQLPKSTGGDASRIEMSLIMETLTSVLHARRKSRRRGLLLAVTLAPSHNQLMFPSRSVDQSKHSCGMKDLKAQDAQNNTAHRTDPQQLKSLYYSLLIPRATQDVTFSSSPQGMQMRMHTLRPHTERWEDVPGPTPRFRAREQSRNHMLQ